MVESLEILHLRETQQVKLQWHSPSGLRTAPPVDFKNPLDESDYEEINWYFQEYFSNPTGEGSARSEAVETGLRNLGRVLFENTFKSNPEALNIYSKLYFSANLLSVKANSIVSIPSSITQGPAINIFFCVDFF